MLRYPEGFNVEEYDELRKIVTERGKRGSFDANDILAEYVQQRASAQGGTVEGYDARPVNAGSVAQILEDVVDLGVLRPIGGDPPRWELAIEARAATPEPESGE